MDMEYKSPPGYPLSSEEGSERKVMKVIIIEEERFTEILERLKVEAEKAALSKPTNRQAIMDTHRSMHFHLVRWMQSHGVKP